MAHLHAFRRLLEVLVKNIIALKRNPRLARVRELNRVPGGMEIKNEKTIYEDKGEDAAVPCCWLTWLEFTSNLRTTLMATSPCCPWLSLALYTLLKAPSPIFSSKVHRSKPGYFGNFPLLSR